MDWVEIAQQIGLGGLAIVGLIYLVGLIIKKKNDKGEDLILGKLNHISDNFARIIDTLDNITYNEKENNEKLNKIITNLAVLLDRNKK